MPTVKQASIHKVIARLFETKPKAANFLPRCWLLLVEFDLQRHDQLIFGTPDCNVHPMFCSIAHINISISPRMKCLKKIHVLARWCGDFF